MASRDWVHYYRNTGIKRLGPLPSWSEYFGNSSCICGIPVSHSTTWLLNWLSNYVKISFLEFVKIKRIQNETTTSPYKCSLRFWIQSFSYCRPSTTQILSLIFWSSYIHAAVNSMAKVGFNKNRIKLDQQPAMILE